MGRRAYQTPAYRAMQADIGAYDVPCYWCGKRADVPDHLIPVALGGGDDDLVPACTPCNARRGGRLGTAIQRSRKRARRELIAQPSRSW